MSLRPLPGETWRNKKTGEVATVSLSNLYDITLDPDWRLHRPSTFKGRGRPRRKIDTGDWFIARRSGERLYVRQVLDNGDAFVLATSKDDPGRKVTRRNLTANYRKGLT